MPWRIAKSLLKLRRQLNAAYPKRDKKSDGSIGDAAHASRSSDHNPWVFDGRYGVVTAIDIDDDVNGKDTIQPIVDAICKSKDRRVKYIIYQGKITVKGTQLQRWKAYNGPNPHNSHVHISVFPNRALYDDESPWMISATANDSNSAVPNEPPTKKPAKPSDRLPKPLRRGDKGNAVKALQLKLKKLGYTITVDGSFGPVTENAVKLVQRANKLTEDGIVGPDTRKALGM
jgi:hypothetical protein